MTALAISPFTMPAALAAADSILGFPIWTAGRPSPAQIKWLESFRRRADIASRMPEVRRNATFSAFDHATWLRQEGWDAQITQGTDRDIFLAATLNILGKWLSPGRKYKEQGLDRVHLRAGAYTSLALAGEHPVVEVVTQHQGYNFCFQQVDTAPRDSQALLGHAISMASRQASQEVCLDFPMVDLLVRDEASYMLGLLAGPNVVTQAAEQLRLELNEIGGRASAAAEVAVTRGMGPKTIKLDGPFVVCVNRQGVPADQDKVAFAAYCDRSVWRAPAAGRI